MTAAGTHLRFHQFDVHWLPCADGIPLTTVSSPSSSASLQAMISMILTVPLAVPLALFATAA
ncbi:hypothetical protein SAMN05661093_05095 [Kibdelosporangium aridum]|uniref:Uncharacterized protein n=1 Tax=Kibdelosporangium aridum TaxID=2030 RepID=A0A1W2EY89_KIBAR|nr:hypothetical protein SAMN05661093_05095 [Kibdelosporangium aridum]